MHRNILIKLIHLINKEILFLITDTEGEKDTFKLLKKLFRFEKATP
jgi:hypothetical protein